MTYLATRIARPAEIFSPVKIICVERELVSKLKKFVD